eukprot:10315240-Ditylum_brightwellii.AAC.1
MIVPTMGVMDMVTVVTKENEDFPYLPYLIVQELVPSCATIIRFVIQIPRNVSARKDLGFVCM